MMAASRHAGHRHALSQDFRRLTVRRVKQGVAEWYRLQLKEKIWKGLIEHSLDGWNIGTPAYGYLAERIQHPVPFKAAQGRTKSWLILDPARAPVIGQIFTWRTVDKLGCPAIAARLNADPAAYPPLNLATGWTAQNVRVILANPKYTGYMVYGRHRTRNGRRTPVPPDQWLWSPAPVHPAIVDRDTWDLAQTIAAGHSTSRDGDELNPHPATARFYPYRSRIRCRDCQRRMTGTTYGKPASLSTYYRCPHNWASPKHAADHPDHPRTVQAAEHLLNKVVGGFFATRVFGPERAALLAAQLPATDAPATADLQDREAALKARIARIETAQNAKILELEDLPANPADPAGQAYRARIRARFAELHEERERLETQLKALAKTSPAAADTSLLDRLPLADDVLPRLSPRLKARLFQVFDITVLWNKPARQATVTAEITEATLQALDAILDPRQDGFHDTTDDQSEPVGHLANTPRFGRTPQPLILGWGLRGDWGQWSRWGCGGRRSAGGGAGRGGGGRGGRGGRGGEGEGEGRRDSRGVRVRSGLVPGPGPKRPAGAGGRGGGRRSPGSPTGAGPGGSRCRTGGWPLPRGAGCPGR